MPIRLHFECTDPRCVRCEKREKTGRGYGSGSPHDHPVRHFPNALRIASPNLAFGDAIGGNG